MISLQSASNQAAVCRPPPHVHDHPFLSVHMYTGGRRVPVRLYCKYATPWWASAHLAVRWESRPPPSHTGKNLLKYIVTACGAYLRSWIALHCSRHIGTADRLAYSTNALSGLANYN